jgi:sialidase-1
MKSLPTLSLLLGLAAAALTTAPQAKADDPVEVFKQGEADFGIYRFPGIVRTKSGTLIVTAEGRKNPEMRWSETLPFLKVSKDGGKTWGAAVQIAEAPADAKQNAILLDSGAAEDGIIGVHNVCPIADKDGGVHLIYTVEYNRVFHVKCDDNGENLSDPVEITAAFEEFKSEVDWKVITTGPSHGVQLESGRLIVPVIVSVGDRGIGLQSAGTSTITSDDGGNTWKRGEIVAADFPLEGKVKTGTLIDSPGEAALAINSKGEVVINIRNKALKGQRAQAVSKDGATGWSDAVFVDGMLEPICQGSLITADAGLVFVNPANMIMRKSLTARLSTDGGATYATKLVIDDGIAGYSDMAADGNTIHLVYERGANPSQTDPEAIVVRSFSAADIK